LTSSSTTVAVFRIPNKARMVGSTPTPASCLAFCDAQCARSTNSATLPPSTTQFPGCNCSIACRITMTPFNKSLVPGGVCMCRFGMQGEVSMANMYPE
jgi:hypothetical protein